MREITFVIEGDPRGKGRPRFAARTRHAYTPAETREYEHDVRVLAKAALREFNAVHDEKWNLAGAIEVDILALFHIPSSWTRAKKRAAMRGEIEPTKKPDIDNIEKIVLDGMKAILVGDDSFVTRLACSKQYQFNEDEDGRVEVTVRKRK